MHWTYQRVVPSDEDAEGEVERVRLDGAAMPGAAQDGEGESWVGED